MMSIGSMPVTPATGSSPRDQIVSTLEEQVESGEITSEDSDAMLAALDSMHEARMAAGESDENSGPPSEDEMQSNFESMLSEQVEAGTLTEDQADELSALFESGELAPPPPPPPPADAASSTETDSSSDEDTTTSTSSSTSSELTTEDLMSALLEQLKNSAGYDNSGSTASSSTDSVFADFLV